MDGIDRFREVTGLPIAPYFSASKILWLLENVPGLRAAALAGEAVFGTVDTWLIYKLTGAVLVLFLFLLWSWSAGVLLLGCLGGGATRDRKTCGSIVGLYILFFFLPSHIPNKTHTQNPQAGRSTSPT